MSALDVAPVSLLETVTGAIRSVNFFNGRLLAGEDLSSEQQAQRAERFLLGRALGDGVAYGFEVYENPARSSHARPVVTVEPGLAVSRDGATLALERRIDIALATVDTAVTDADPGAGVFSDCLTSVPGVYTSGAGVYVLTVGPSSSSRGRAPLNGQADGGSACAVDASVEGVQFRLVGVPNMTAEELAPAFAPRLRSHVAHLMLGTGDTARKRFRFDPFGPRVTTYGRLDEMLAAGLLTTGEVPLAALAWTESHGLQFVDLWAVRRRLTRRAETDQVPAGLAGQAAIPRPSLGGDRARSESEALARQFERQVEDLRTTVALETLVASTTFEYLPAAGLLPLARTGSRGVVPETFFGAQASHDGATIDASLVPPLLHEALSHEPIEVGGAEPIQLYLLWESELALQTGASTQAALVFAKHTVPYRGTRRYGYARFGAGRVSRW
jgi:hypothetical protein